jgi:hypothetical protein
MPAMSQCQECNYYTFKKISPKKLNSCIKFAPNTQFPHKFPKNKSPKNPISLQIPPKNLLFIINSAKKGSKMASNCALFSFQIHFIKPSKFGNKKSLENIRWLSPSGCSALQQYLTSIEKNWYVKFAGFYAYILLYLVFPIVVILSFQKNAHAWFLLLPAA